MVKGVCVSQCVAVREEGLDLDFSGNRTKEAGMLAIVLQSRGSFVHRVWHLKEPHSSQAFGSS